MNKAQPKKKMLVVGITMNCAGSEKSFLSFASCLDYEKYDVDLLLARKEGLFLDLVPKQINIIEMEKYNDMFLLSGANAAKTMFRCFVKENPLTLFEILPYFLKIIFVPSKKSYTATRMWCDIMRRHTPPFKGEYDVALAYWGDRTMFYMVDNVTAKNKIAWLHFDFNHPPRDNELYLSYFKQCDKVVTVSDTIDNELKKTLPEIADKCVMMNNINNPKLIWDLALRGETFPDRQFKGKRLLSIIRISEQKGIDMIPEILFKLRADGYNVRWYIIGDGTQDDKSRFIESLLDAGVADMLILLGTTVNPYSYLRDSDIYVQPSRYEGKPITVEEAKIMYRPIVAANYVSANEQLNGGEYGIITEISAEGLYRGIKRMLDDEEKRDGFTLKLSKINFGNTDEINKFYDMDNK